MQRRRADIRHYLETDTAFPERKDKEATYTFSKEYRALFDDILAFAREYVSDERWRPAPAPSAVLVGACAAALRLFQSRRCGGDAAQPRRGGSSRQTKRWMRSAGERCSTRTMQTMW